MSSSSSLYIFWHVSTRLRGRIALVRRSLLEILKFHGVGTALMRNFDLYFTKRWTFILSDVRLTRCSLVNRTRRIGPKTFMSFLEIPADSGGSASCDTQLNCRALFHNSYCTFVITFYYGQSVSHQILGVGSWGIRLFDSVLSVQHLEFCCSASCLPRCNMVV